MAGTTSPAPAALLSRGDLIAGGRPRRPPLPGRTPPTAAAPSSPRGVNGGRLLAPPPPPPGPWEARALTWGLRDVAGWIGGSLLPPTAGGGAPFPAISSASNASSREATASLRSPTRPPIGGGATGSLSSEIRPSVSSGERLPLPPAADAVFRYNAENSRWYWCCRCLPGWSDAARADTGGRRRGGAPDGAGGWGPPMPPTPNASPARRTGSGAEGDVAGGTAKGVPIPPDTRWAGVGDRLPRCDRRGGERALEDTAPPDTNEPF